MYARLVNGVPVECELLEWADYMKTANRKICDTYLADGSHISTVFLGLDHGFGGRKMWFETLVFGGPQDGLQNRYADIDSALDGHFRIVEVVRGK